MFFQAEVVESFT